MVCPNARRVSHGGRRSSISISRTAAAVTAAAAAAVAAAAAQQQQRHLPHLVVDELRVILLGVLAPAPCLRRRIHIGRVAATVALHDEHS